MFSWHYTVVFIVLCLFFLVFSVQRATLDKQAKQLEQLQQQQHTALASLKQAKATLKASQQLANQRQQQYQTLLNNTEQLNQQLKQRDIQLKEQYHERTTRDWATTDLPDTIKQLRNRPALTSASDYREHLHNAHPVPTASDQPANQ